MKCGIDWKEKSMADILVKVNLSETEHLQVGMRVYSEYTREWYTVTILPNFIEEGEEIYALIRVDGSGYCYKSRTLSELQEKVIKDPEMSVYFSSKRGKNPQNKPIIPRKPNPIRKVYFNKEKDTTVVLWEDGEKTILKRDSRDEWDYEKAVAMAFMKKYFNNRAYYYDRLQEIIEDAEIIGDEQGKAITFIGLHSVLGMNMYDLCREWVKEMKNPPIADLPPTLRYIVEELDRLATLEQEEEMKRILSDDEW